MSRTLGGSHGVGWTGGFAVRILLLVCGAPLLLGGAPAQPQQTCLIVVSDGSVQKYSTVHESFKNAARCSPAEIDVGAAGIDEDRLRKVMEETSPGVVFCIGSKAYLMAQEVARDDNIVVSSAINWQRFSLGRRTYGIANELSTEMQLTTFRYFFPGMARIGVAYSKRYNREWVEEARKAARDLGLEIQGEAVSGRKELKREMAALLPEVDALWLIPDPVVLSDAEAIEEIFRSSKEAGKPVFAYSEAFAAHGAAMIISPDLPTVGRQAAGLVERLLGGKPMPERFQAPAGSAITVNLKVIESLGFSMNRDALDSVNRIIE